MFLMSRLSECTGEFIRRLAGGKGRRRRALLMLEELEVRIVPTLLGRQLFPADYPWNQNISAAPVAANSAAVISHIGGSIGIHPDWGDDSPSNGNSPLYGIPFNVVHGNTTPKVSVSIDDYPDESDLVPVPIPANAVLEGDYQNGPNPNGPGYGSGQRGDSHLIVWDEDNNIAYELYAAARPSDPVTFDGAPTGGQWHAAQETVWNMNTDAFRSLGDTSADAAGLSILAGLVRPDEGLPTSQGGQGAINHALRFTLPSGDVNAQYLYPASHVVGHTSSSMALPLGARLRLENTPAVNAVIGTLGPEAQIIARAMQQYGLVLADIGSPMYVTGASAAEDANNTIDFTWNMNDVLTLKALTASDFQVVNLTPRVTGLSVSSGSAGTAVTVIGQNFSGAAGRLAVTFGGVAATSVTYVDDAHLSVVVPNGSGTVHVQVQSGIDETDPNNPNDNVNNPIFGYGISTVSTSDQFTYSGQTISGVNSTVRFATPTVASGNTDTLTIVVEDGTGKPVSGLASGAFRFTLAGVSAGMFGTMSETATKGTYTAVFTATTPGTASTLTAAVAGVILTTQPTIQTLLVTALAADFAGSGVWRYEGAGWVQLTPTDAVLMAVDANGIVTADFRGSGVWRYEDSTSPKWQQLTRADATLLAAAGNGVAAADFAGSGVWRYEDGAGWIRLSSADAALLAVDANGDVAAEFRGSGVWRYEDGVSPRWQQLTPADAALLALAGNGVVAAEFAGSGVWRYQDGAGWLRLSPADAALVAVDANGDVTAEFKGSGAWRYENGTIPNWRQLTAIDAALLAATDDGVAAAEFAGAGVWRYEDGVGWVRLSLADAALLAVGL